jgi:hypothetical protein
MFHNLWTFIKKQIVTDVPDETDACLDCGVADCFASQYDTCFYRLTCLRHVTLSNNDSDAKVATEGTCINV